MITYQAIVPAVLDTSDDGLTWAELAADLPTDPASVFTLALLVFCMTLVIWAGRNKPGGGGSVPPAIPG